MDGTSSTNNNRLPKCIKKCLFVPYYSLIHFAGEKNADRLLCKLIVILCANFLIKQVFPFSRPGSQEVGPLGDSQVKTVGRKLSIRHHDQIFLWTKFRDEAQLCKSKRFDG